MKAFIFVVCLFSMVFAVEDEIVANVLQGAVKGIRLYNYKGEIIHGYLGIPYAAPPVGHLRFKDPEPPQSWNGIKDGSAMPDYCMQYNVGLKILGKNPVVGLEDCLYLNIYKPSVTSWKKPLPVIIFLHGGAFLYGGAKDYTPRNFLDYDVILVVIQYRLGVLGFISTNERPLTGNYGLKDQQMAIEWVYRNIGSFNGNSDRITLLGESAGAASVHYHMLSDGSRGLFRRAIMMSGNALSPWAHSTHHKDFAIELGQQFDCTLKKGTTIYRDCMQKVDAKNIAKYHGSTMEFLTLPNYMLPRVDGSFLKNYPEILMKYQYYTYVDVIVGITGDEGARILAEHDLEWLILKEKTKIDVMLMLEKENTTNDVVGDIILKYENSSKYFSSLEELTIQMYGDRYLGFAHHMVATLFRENTNMKTYLYELEYITESKHNDSFSRIPSIYASQMENLRLLFNGGGAFTRPLTSPDDLAIKDLLLSFFVEFVKTGRVQKKNEQNKLIWKPASPALFQELKIRLMPQRITYPLLYCEMEAFNSNDFLLSWLLRPLEQSFLLRSENKEKLTDLLFGEDSNKCYTPEPLLSKYECIDYINNVQKHEWIEKSLRNHQVEAWIVAGPWRSFKWSNGTRKVLIMQNNTEKPDVPGGMTDRERFPMREEL